MRDEGLISDHDPAAIALRLAGQPKQQYISDAVLGGIDGCITTFAVVSGSVGAGFPATVAVVLGFANLIADGFSMAISNYESCKTEHESIKSIRESEAKHIDLIPEGEREEVRQIFRAKGFDEELLEEIVATITENKEIWLETMLTEEHGVRKTAPDPWKSAGATFAAFLVVGAIPLLPFLWSSASLNWQFMSSTLLAGIMFFLIGMLKSLAFNQPVLLSGLRTLLTGGAAAMLAYYTAYFLREIFNIV